MRRPTVTPLRVKLLGIVVLLAVSADGFAAASTQDPQTVAASLPLSYRAWTVDPGDGGTKVSTAQLYVPLVLTLRPRPRLDLVFATGEAKTSSGPEGGRSSDVSGLAATSVQAFWRLRDERTMLQAGIGLPAGKRELDPAEFSTMQQAGLPVLGFRLKHYGHGGEVAAGASRILTASDRATLSMAAGGILRGAYVLQAGQDKYRPASEWSLTAGADLGVPETGSGSVPLKLDATFRRFGEDEIGGTRVYREGNQFEARVQTRTAHRAWRLQTSALAVFKGTNEVFGTGGTAIAGLKASGGSAWFLRARIEAPGAKRMEWGLESEWNSVSGSDLSGRDGWALGAGPSVGLPVADGTALRAQLLYLTGRLASPGGLPDATLRGWSAAIGFRWTPSP
jgi:hypothetical protein